MTDYDYIMITVNHIQAYSIKYSQVPLYQKEVNMIYTITFNPSLDYIVNCDNFTLGETNRASYELILPGGKGINVSIVLRNLGIDNTALGFLAGFTGQEIERLIEKEGIKNEMIKLDNGFSRINIKLRSNFESELNGIGPTIDKDSLKLLYKKLDKLNSDDILVLAGSIPSSLPQTIYSDIFEYLKDKNIKIVVDATKKLLLNVLPFKPFLIKPNNHELGDLFNVTLNTKQEVIPYAKKLQEMGARNVLVSMAKDGALLVDEKGEVYQSMPPKGKLVNSVGAGDSMVAGFIYGYLTYNDYNKAFKYGLSAGSASAFKENLATKEEIENLYKTI